ncbi:hypothetical protein [Kribbella lupini]|uniref:Fibronectin type-III domain-containing protein n=1 Tax=Kribbella lupini TaxID=291602 RepID=A0ABP4N8A4_9ACTN
MKKQLGLVLAAGMAASVLVAAPASATDVVPTNVRIAWKDTTFQTVVVSWDEAEPVGNSIQLFKRGFTTAYYATSFLADQPNSVEVPAATIRAANWREGRDTPFEFAVSASGGPKVVSMSFDANTPDAPEVVSRTLSTAGVSTVRWKDASRDTTPNDPLDRTEPLTYQVNYVPTGSPKSYPIGARTAATQATYTLRSPYSLYVAGYNEWGNQFYRRLLTAEATRLTAKVPSWVVYQDSARVTGTYTPATESRPVVLQARNSSTSPWYVVASAVFRSGKFGFQLGTGGSRQYRVVTPTATYSAGAVIAYGASTAPAASTTQLRTSGFFTGDPILAGMRNTAGVYVYPALNTTAQLQRWTGTAWSTVGPVTVKAGTGYGSVLATKPGRTAYRFYVPVSRTGGTWFAAAYTNTFVNNVGQ